MKPAAFAYHAPETLDEALELLSRGDGTSVLAGGQSLVQLMKFRLAKPSVLVDVNGVAGLDVLEKREVELHVGNLLYTTHAADD
jgi:carbon-monoxide dehydrogenase medium subunit